MSHSTRTANAPQENKTIAGSGTVVDSTGGVESLPAAAIPAKAKHVKITVRSGTLLFTCDGVDPAGNAADVLLENNSIILSDDNARNLKMLDAIVYSQALAY